MCEGILICELRLDVKWIDRNFFSNSRETDCCVRNPILKSDRQLRIFDLDLRYSSEVKS
jgi:hypothetical protein